MSKLRSTACRAGLVAILIAGPVCAQVRCVMPNGVTITQRFSAKCPSGALESKTLDGDIADVRVLNESAEAVKQDRVSPPEPVLESKGRAMDFSACTKMMQNQVLEHGVARTRVIVNTDILKSLRICTAEGSVLMTCSHPDRKMVLTKSTTVCD